MSLSQSYVSRDRRFAVHLPLSTIQRLLGLAQDHHDNETGGILIGSLSADLVVATVHNATSPPRDSLHRRLKFVRGRRGLRSILRRYWREREFHYLGEWHTHPSSDPTPSSVDIAQMKSISESPRYDCETPILIVIGGLPAFQPKISVNVFDKRAGKLINLIPQVDFSIEQSE